MHRIITTILLSLLMTTSLIAKDQRPVVNDLLVELDRVLDSADYYIVAKEQRIDQIKSRIAQQPSDEQMHILKMMLFEEYAKYDSDAAFELVIDSANKSYDLGLIDNYTMWCVNRAYLYTASGLLKEASDILAQTRPLITSRQVLLEYYRQMEYLLSHLGQYTTGNERISPEYYRRKEAYVDSIAMVIKPRDRYYLVNKGWQHNNSDSTAYYRGLLEQRLNRSKIDNHDDAMDAYTIAHMYLSDDDQDKFIEYLIQSAKADIRSNNHDIASLQELAQLLLEAGDINRAYSYLSYALERAKSFGDRVRVMEIATLLDATYGELLGHNRAQSRSLVMLLALLVVLFLAVILLLLNLRRRNDRLHATLASLDELNIKLDQHNAELERAYTDLNLAYDDLQQLNESLRDSNYIKENYIGNTFEAFSIHIGKMERIFVKISSLVRNNKLDELRRYCDSSLLLNAELKLLYQAFDYTFLKIYPSFVERVNELLLEDKQIKLRSDETLNTELRIYALNRLGITDNQQIASILHCSLQTVYNNYQKMKNRTDLSSKELLSEIMKIH